MNKRRIEFEGSEIEIELYTTKLGKKIYDAYLLKGSWPVSRDLIILCDGGDPYSDQVLCDGGKVSLSDKGLSKHRVVEVYV